MSVHRYNAKAKLYRECLESRRLLTDIGTGLIGHWSLNDNADVIVTDHVGGAHGILQGDANWLANGKVRHAIEFNGVNAQVEIPSSSAHDIVVSEFTFSVWVRTLGDSGVLVAKGPLSAHNIDHAQLSLEEGRPRFQFSTGVDAVGVTGSVSIADGQWHHVPGVRTGTNAGQLYVDGSLEGSFDVGIPWVSIDTTAPLRIGGNESNFFLGSLDDVRYYGRALTVDDIDALVQLSEYPLAADDAYGVESSMQLSVSAEEGVLANDVRSDDTPLAATLVDEADHGSLILNRDGSFQYVPRAGFAGVDQFAYQVSDGRTNPTRASVSLLVYDRAEWEEIGQRVSQTANSVAANTSFATADSFLRQMRADGRFADLAYEPDTLDGMNDLASHMRRLGAIGHFFKTPGNLWYRNPSVLDAVRLSWDFVADSAPETSAFSNWFVQKIFIPNELGWGLAIIRDEVDSSLVGRLTTKYFDNVASWDLNDLTERNGGMNLALRARAAVLRAVLQDDPLPLLEVRTMISRDLNYDGLQASGPRPDGSFHQHTSFPLGSTFEGGVHEGDAVQFHSGAYGIGYTKTLADVVPWLQGTQFALSATDEAAAVSFLLDGQQWLFRNGTIEPTSTGRTITSDDSQIVLAPGVDTVLAISKMLSLGIRTDELERFRARLVDGTTSDNALVGNRPFWTSDVMVQQSPDYMAAVRMISQRTQRPETLQSSDRSTPEGAQHYFLGDGVTTLFRTGEEYGANSHKEIFPVWNWTRLPGTTLEQLSADEVRSLSSATPPWSTSDENIGAGLFVGSVSNGLVGAAAMDYGRSRGNVVAKKSWFFFEEGLVALGADIDAPHAKHPVNTTLDQVLKDNQTIVRAPNGTTVLSRSDDLFSVPDANWVWHGNTGYVPLLDGNDSLTVSRERRTGRWEDIGSSTGEVQEDVFTLYFDHGMKPVDASYAYAVLPGVSTADLDAWVKDSPLQILSNNEFVQAVRHKQTGVTQIAFFVAGTLELSEGFQITVDRPAMIQIVEQTDGTLELSVSDPTQSADVIQISLTGNFEAPGVTRNAANGQSVLSVSLPSGHRDRYRGQSTTITLMPGADPEIIVDAPHHLTIHSTGPIPISGEAFDNVAIKKVDIAIYNEQNLTWNGSAFTTAYSRVSADTAESTLATNWSYTFDPPAAGKYSFRATAYDGLGNLSSTWWQIVAADFEAPTLDIHSENLHCPLGPSHAISGTVNDDISIAAVQLVLYNDSLLTWDGHSFNTNYTRVTATLGRTADDLSWSYDFVPSELGVFTFRVFAIDHVGRLTESAWGRCVSRISVPSDEKRLRFDKSAHSSSEFAKLPVTKHARGTAQAGGNRERDKRFG